MNILLKLFSLTILLCSMAFSHSDYWLVDEYLKEHKGEKTRFEAFNQLVQNQAMPLYIKQEKPIKIVMVYPAKQISDYWRRSKLSFQKRLDELNVKYELIDYFTKPAALKEQSKQLIKAINNDTDYLIFTLDVKKHYKFIEKILARQKPKLILQNITTPLKKWKNRQPFLYVGFDHVIGTKMLAKYYLQQHGKTGKYAVLFGTKGYVSLMRGESFINYMKQHSKMKLEDVYYTNYSKTKAMLATKQLLEEHKDLDFIYACSTDIALGAMDVIQEQGFEGKVVVNGWGGGSQELEALQKGKLDMTVMRMNDDNGVAMAEAIKLDIQNKEKQVPLIYSGDFRLLPKNIQVQQLDELKKRAFRYSK